MGKKKEKLNMVDLAEKVKKEKEKEKNRSAAIIQKLLIDMILELGKFRFNDKEIVELEKFLKPVSNFLVSKLVSSAGRDRFSSR